MDDRFLFYFKNKLLSNKGLMALVLLTAVACFGFTVTNYSIGVDDPAAGYYFAYDSYGSMLQQGRLLHILYGAVTGAFQFIPFFNDFVGAVLYCLSALLFCGLFLYVSEGRLTDMALAAFCCTYISYSLLAEKFIYNLDVVVTMSSYCTGALALVYTHKMYTENSKMDFLKAVGLLVLSISSYESFVFLYICGVFSVFLVRMLVGGEKLSFKALLFTGLRCAAMLLCACAVYYFAVFCAQLAFGQAGVFQRGTAFSGGLRGALTVCLRVTERLIRTFARTGNLALREFALFALGGGLLFLLLAVKKKNIWLFFCFCGLVAGNLLLTYVMGLLCYRTCQSFCLFVALLVMLAAHFVKGKTLKRAMAGAVALLVFVQAANMNLAFYNDHIRYKKDAFAVDSIATELVSRCDVSKPVVFVRTPTYSYLDGEQYPGRQMNGESAIYWGAAAFDDPTAGLLLELFRMQGYDFLIPPTAQQAAEGAALAQQLPVWPQPGSIQEYEQILVVHLG